MTITDEKLREAVAHYEKLFGAGAILSCTGINEATDKILLGIPDAAKCGFYLNTIEAALAELETLRAANTWQPIEKAPKERTLVLASWESKLVPGKMHSALTWTDSKDFKSCKRWAYLPTPPKEASHD